jgi:long-chain acyl-CoA synthetase
MDPIWLKSYPSNVPNQINYQNETLQDLFSNACTAFAELPAYTSMGRTLSYAEFQRYAEHFANFCQYELKLQKGDRLAIMLPNLLQYPIAVFGATLAGVTLVNLNPMDKGPSLQHELKDSGAKALIVLENFVSELLKVVDSTDLQHIIVASSGDLQPWPQSLLINFYLRYVKKQIPHFHLPHQIRFMKALHLGAQHSFNKVAVLPEDMAFIQYTGGTTGIAKGAMLSHKNLTSNVLQCYTWIREDLVEGEERIITALPLYHIFSLMVNNFVFMKLGGESILIADPRDMPHFIKVLRESGFTCINGVNTLFNGLLYQEEFHKLDFSHLKMTIAGGMALQQKVADDWQKVTGCVISQGYGLTEASPVVCINPVKAKKFIGSIGLPIPSTEVTILNQDGHEVPLGETGELCVKGPQVMQGYWHNEAETQHVLQNGWLHTGDAAYMDKEGFVYLVDRLKNMLIVSGFKVFPNEVENLLKTLPGVNEVAVIGVPNEQHGQVVKAVIVKDKGSNLTQEEVIKFCHDRLVAYKVPHVVEFMDSLPKSSVGKILKREIK